jgi:hypothetical protein
MSELDWLEVACWTDVAVGVPVLVWLLVRHYRMTRAIARKSTTRYNR